MPRLWSSLLGVCISRLSTKRLVKGEIYVSVRLNANLTMDMDVHIGPNLSQPQRTNDTPALKDAPFVPRFETRGSALANSQPILEAGLSCSSHFDVSQDEKGLPTSHTSNATQALRPCKKQERKMSTLTKNARNPAQDTQQDIDQEIRVEAGLKEHCQGR